MNILPRKIKNKPWQVAKLHPDYPMWFVTPIPAPVIHWTKQGPMLGFEFGDSPRFHTSDEALGYYESKAYENDYAIALQTRASQLRWLADYVERGGKDEVTTDQAKAG